jgi:EAL domain-containing protein (putative c-di-GMP-specific phosphodiesterase class I)
VDFVKIAGSFVRDVADNPETLALVRAIVELSRALGKQTVAECVESDAAVVALRRLGVDYLQGHRIGLPESIVPPG